MLNRQHQPSPNISWLLCWLWLSASTVAQEPVTLLNRWEFDPKLEGNWEAEIVEYQAVLHPELLRSEVLEDRVHEAQRAVFWHASPNLENGEEALQAIMQNILAGEGNRQALLTMTAAAVALSDGREADALWNAVSSDPAARLVVERALGGWKSDLALPGWRERLADSSTPHEALFVAIEGVAQIGDARDRDVLEKLIKSDWASIANKLAASKALGQLLPSGLEGLASQVLASDLPHRELLAANLLRTHTSPEALGMLVDILKSDNNPAHAVAYRAITDADIDRARALAEELLKDEDNTVRMQAVQVLVRFDDETSLRTLAYALRDKNPTVRRAVRENMQRLAGQYRPFVDEAISFYLSGDFAEGAEQAIVLSVALNKTDVCSQLVSLLEHPHPPVYVRAAWGLQELAETDEIMARALPVANKTTEVLKTSNQVPHTEVVRTAFLLQAFGRNKYMPANDMLMLYVPKNGLNLNNRAAAIWALGHIWQDSENAELARALAQRLHDNNPLDPEDDIVKYASALSLGRIKHPSSVAELRRTMETIPQPIGYAVQWSLAQFDSE